MLKWTPNSLMDSSRGEMNVGSRKTSPASMTSWNQAISINMATILYIHCHQVDWDWLYAFKEM